MITVIIYNNEPGSSEKTIVSHHATTDRRVAIRRAIKRAFRPAKVGFHQEDPSGNPDKGERIRGAVTRAAGQNAVGVIRRVSIETETKAEWNARKVLPFGME